MNTLVTIAIPTYNRADTYLKKSLSSAIGQTYQNIEIIVSDNCSTDNTESVVKDFKDSRIRYYRQKENIGPYKNFNFCLQQAKGDYFLIISDDDIVDRDFVDVCIKAAHFSTDIGIVRTGSRIIDSEGTILRTTTNEVVGLSTEAFIRAWLQHKTAIYPCSTLFSTEKLREIGGFGPENNLFHDCIVILNLASKYGRVDVPDIKASFRKHDDSITREVEVKDWCKDSLLLLDAMCKLVSEKNRGSLRELGMQFFIRLNYQRTKNVRILYKRWLTYIFVFKTFKYRYLPPPVNNLICRKLYPYILRMFIL